MLLQKRGILQYKLNDRISLWRSVPRFFYALYTLKSYSKCAITASVMPWVFTFMKPSRYISPVR